MMTWDPDAPHRVDDARPATMMSLAVAAVGALVSAVMMAVLLSIYMAGQASMADLASTAFAREEQWRNLLEPVVVAGQEALAVVEAHDSIRARELRRSIPVDVLQVMREADYR